MGESKRRKLLDPNYGKNEIILTVAFFPLFVSTLTMDLVKEIQDKLKFCKDNSYKPFFVIRRVNAKFYGSESTEIAYSWLLVNGIDQESIKDFFFPLDDNDEDKITANFLESITRKQHRKPSVLMFINNDLTDKDFVDSLNNRLK
jgi:hypothetical protein